MQVEKKDSPTLNKKQQASEEQGEHIELCTNARAEKTGCSGNLVCSPWNPQQAGHLLPRFTRGTWMPSSAAFLHLAKDPWNRTGDIPPELQTHPHTNPRSQEMTIHQEPACCGQPAKAEKTTRDITTLLCLDAFKAQPWPLSRQNSP